MGYTYITFSLSSLERKKLEEASFQLRSDIRYIQKLSMIENKEYIFLFYPSQSRYDTFVKTDNNYELINIIYLPDETVTIENNATNSMIFFTKRGTAQNGATIILQTKKYKLEMTVLVSSGRVEIKEIIKRPGGI